MRALTFFMLINSTLFSQSYKTILLKKDSRNVGVIRNSDLLKSSTAYTFFVKKYCNEYYASKDTTILKKTKKIVLFKINMKEYKQKEQVFVKFVTQNINKLNTKRPLITVFYDTTSKVKIIPKKFCSYNHEFLKANHLLSFIVDTSIHYMYIAVAFPQTFNSQFTYSITSKSHKPESKKEFGYVYGLSLYHHPYDYKKLPPFFMEAGFYESYLFCSSYGVNLNETALTRPHIKEGKDSLFFNKWMKNFIELASIDTSLVLYCNSTAQAEITFDKTGNLVSYEIFSIDEFTHQKQKSTTKDCAYLLNLSLPKEYNWTPALNFEEKPFNYTYKIVFEADFCWN